MTGRSVMEMPQAYAKAADWVETLIQGTTTDQYGDPTPCPEWNVRELLNHIIGGTHFFTMVMTNQEIPDGGDLGDLVGDDPAGAFRAGADAFLGVLSDASNLEGMVHPPFGDMPAPAFAGLSLIDSTAHGWDLAKATGQDTTIPADVVAIADPMARVGLASFPRSPQVFDEEVPVDDSASAQDKFIAFLGRQP